MLKAILIPAPPDRNPEGTMCGLCDSTTAHEHPRLQCSRCGAIGLAENMRGHVCDVRKSWLPPRGIANRYRRKPTIITAQQFRVVEAHSLPAGVCMKACLDGDWIKAHVHTAHNNQAVILEDGDWVLPEPDGVHFYPCKPDIFEATYELVY